MNSLLLVIVISAVKSVVLIQKDLKCTNMSSKRIEKHTQGTKYGTASAIVLVGDASYLDKNLP